MARIFFFTGFSVFLLAAGETQRLFSGKRNPNDKGIPQCRQRKTRRLPSDGGVWSAQERKNMRWLFAVVLPFFIPLANVAAQEVSAAVLGNTSSPSAGFPAPPAEPLPQAIRDDVVKDTWELGLGYALVGFRSAPFNAT